LKHRTNTRITLDNNGTKPINYNTQTDKDNIMIQVATTKKLIFLLACYTSSMQSASSFVVISPSIHNGASSKKQHTINKWMKRTTPLFSTIVEKIEDPFLKKVDRSLISPIVRVATHIPAILTLYYFGLVSMASMMMPAATTTTATTTATTLSSVLTQFVGPTSNAEFSKFFPTLITPANPVFLVWPVIAASQVILLSYSTIKAATYNDKKTHRKPSLFDQDDLTTLSLSNLFATLWIIIASRSSEGMLPIGSCLVLPIVPLISGFQLRRKDNYNDNKKSKKNLVFQLFSSFTTIASLLSLTVELQHGNRIPFFFNKPELSALVFLYGYYTILSRGGGKNGIVKRIINAVAITGILTKRIADATGVVGLFTSLTFWITSGITALAMKQLFFSAE